MSEGHPLFAVHAGLLPFLQFTADAVAELLGFRHCLINLRDDADMVVIAAAGEHPPHAEVPLRELGVGGRVPYTVFQHLLERSDANGGWTDFRHSHGHPDLLDEQAPEAGAHAHHTIFAPLWDDTHATVGVLSAVMPEGADTPTSAQIELVRRYAAQAGTAIRVALGLRDDLRQIRVSDNSRAAVRTLANAPDPDVEWTGVLSQIADAYEADDVIVHRLLPDGAGIFMTSRVRTAAASPIAHDHLTALARTAWESRQVRIVTRDDLASGLVAEPMRELVEAWFGRTGIGSALLVPIGAGEECLGSLVISRRPGSRAWSETELRGATALGADLGLVILTRRTLEQQAKYITELQAIDAYQDQLVATVTGMLRAPLERIGSRLEVLAPIPDGERTAEIEQDVQEMNQLVDDLLFFSRVTDPRRPREGEPVNIASLTRRAVDLVSPMAERAGLRLSVRVSERAPLVIGEESELNRMVTNIVSNAVRFTEAGTIAVSVASGAAEAEVTIRDTGTGIPADDQSEVFTEFFRGENADGLPGSGLGLAIASRIASRHGGRILLASEAGTGTTVRIYLPLAPAAAITQRHDAS